MSVKPVRLEIYRTAIPMRRFEHAAAGRTVAEAVVVRLELSDGRVGAGETLPRPYVTGETIETVCRDLAETIWPALVSARQFATAGDIAAAIPSRDGRGRCINAAACAMELAALASLHLPGGAARRIAARVSGVLGCSDPAGTARRLRLMRLFGLRDFKLKLGLGEDVDGENLRVVARQIRRAVAAGKCTLRVDVNGGWDAADAPGRIEALRPSGVCAVEQPVYCSAGEMVELAQKCSLPLMADESLITIDDANVLLAEPQRIWWNVRISKNGGYLASLRLATLAARRSVPFTLGCMVGESSILSAWQRRLLELGPPPRFVEGNYGRFALADDLTNKRLRFGYGGRLKPAGKLTSAAKIDPGKLARYGSLVETLRA